VVGLFWGTKSLILRQLAAPESDSPDFSKVSFHSMKCHVSMKSKSFKNQPPKLWMAWYKKNTQQVTIFPTNGWFQIPNMTSLLWVQWMTGFRGYAAERGAAILWAVVRCTIWGEGHEQGWPEDYKYNQSSMSMSISISLSLSLSIYLYIYMYIYICVYVYIYISM
jgi:hypothetical protein